MQNGDKSPLSKCGMRGNDSYIPQRLLEAYTLPHPPLFAQFQDSLMRPSLRASLLCASLLSVATCACAADAFDRLNAADLQDTAAGTGLESFTTSQAAKTKMLPGTDSACLVIKTDQGNWTKVLVSWQFKKSQTKPVPVLLIERHATFESKGRDVTVASGGNVMLFAGFQYDFDIGQVVPEGQGGDVQFQPNGQVKALGGAQIFALDGSKFAPAGTAKKPADRDGVSPEDFSGTWKINADGRWAGTLTMTVDASGVAQGEFLMDDSKSLYKATGKVAPGQVNRLKLNVELANATLAFDSFVWTKDKSAMAGTVTLIGKQFGFYAVRDEK